MFESFQYRDFRWLWLGSFASFLAMGMQMVARGWLVLRLSDDSPLALSLVVIAFSLPMTFMSLIGGALADRIQRKYLIMTAQAGNAVVTILLATLDLTGLVRFWHILAVAFANGLFLAINMPSRQALVSELVPEDGLMNAISLNSSGMNLTRIIGPALAGVLIIYINTSGVFYLIAGCYVFSLLSVAMIETADRPANKENTGMTDDIRNGIKYAVGDPILRGLIITLFMPVFFGFSFFILLPAWAREALDVESDGLGMLMMTMGAGSLIGSLMLASMQHLKKRGSWLLTIGGLWGGALAFFSQSGSYATCMPFLLLTGMMSAVFMSLNTTLLQTYSAAEMRGRIMSIAMMSFGAMPLSAIPFGAIAENIGTPDAIGLSGLMLFVFAVIFAVADPEFRRIE
jgi:MFS family permease